MDMKALNELLAKIQEDPSSVTDEQLNDATAAIREQVAAAEKMPATSVEERTARIEHLKQVKAVRDSVIEQQASRAAAAADMDKEAADLVADLAEPAKDETPAEKPDEPQAPADGDQPATEVAAENETPVTEPELEPVAASGANLADAIVKGIDAAFAARDKAATTEVVGRKAERITPRDQAPGQFAANGDVIRAKMYGGKDAQGSPIESTGELAKALHDKFRTVYQDTSYSGRIPIAHVGFEYPESRSLSSEDVVGNFNKIEAATSRTALVAAGGLCAPLEVLYDVENIGSSKRPVRDQALSRFQVDRGGITYRPSTSAATAVHGAGQWTMDDDVANDGREKACYEVECPNLNSEYVWAAYSCLQFSNVTTRFDPETTASNVYQGEIAHSRLAENLLLSKMAAGSKLLTSTRTIGATRDLLANVDKVSAYFRSRHRIDEALPLQWVAPFWAKFLMRADIARQMAAGDWKEALGVADAEIEGWFNRRGVTPVWHMDGLAGTDEVQTVTITGTPTGGSFTLTYAGQTTTAIAYNATAAQVKSALTALSNITDDAVSVTGGPGPGTPYTVTFGGGEFDGANVAQMTSTGSFTGGSTPAVAVATTTGGDGAITVNGVTIPAQTYDNANAGDQIPGFPDKLDTLLYVPGSWLFLDGGTLDLGLVRDSGLNAKNKYRQFMETFEGAANRGVESLRLVMPVQPTGQTAGTKDLDSIVD